MPKKSYSTPEINVEEAVNHINRYSLPYGLCKGVGIDTDGMTPREAWEAWENKTGKTKAQAEKEHWGEDSKEQKKEKEKTGVPKKEDRTKSREEAIKKMFESDRIYETKTFSKKRFEANLRSGTEEMQETTANLFNDDGFIYKGGRDKSTYFSPADNRVQYKEQNDGGEGSVYQKGSVFYHETWHAIDYNYSEYTTPLSTTYDLSDGKTLINRLDDDMKSIDWESVKKEVENERKIIREELANKYEYSKEAENAAVEAVVAVVKEWRNLPTPKPSYTHVLESEEMQELKRLRALDEKASLEARNTIKRKWGDLSDVLNGYSHGEDTLCGMGHKYGYWKNGTNRATEVFAEIASAKAANNESYEVLKKYIPNTVNGFNEIYEKLKNGELKANGYRKH